MARDVFITKKPDLNEAINFLEQAREKQLLAIANVYPEFNNPAMRAKQIEREAKEFSQNAINNGADPVAGLYSMSEAYGYQSKVTAMSERIQSIAAAQNATRTLGSTAGSAVSGASIESVAKSEDDFAKWVGENPTDIRKMLGG